MIQPTGHNVLFKPFEGDSVTTGGILIPDSYRQPSNRGTIVATGRGSADKPMKVKAGDIAYRVKDYGQEIMENGQLYYLFHQDAILAVE